MKKRATTFGRTPYNPFTGKYAGLYSFNDEVVTNELWPAKLQEELQSDGKVSVKRLNEYGEEYGEAIDIWILISKSENINVDMVALPYLGLDSEGNDYEDIVMCFTDTNGDMFLAPASGGDAKPSITVVPIEQPQADGTIAVKELMATVSATAAMSPFDACLFRNGQACPLSALTISLGLTSIGVFDGTTFSGVTFHDVELKKMPSGDEKYCVTDPQYLKAAPCEVAE